MSIPHDPGANGNGDQDDDLAPLPDDFVVPDDASALAGDRAAHRISGLPELDPLLVRSIFAAVAGFVSTFAMFTGLMAIMAGCSDEAECAAAFPGPVASFLVLFTPVLTAVFIIIGIRFAKERRTRLRLVTIAIFVPIVLAAIYFTLL